MPEDHSSHVANLAPEATPAVVMQKFNGALKSRLSSTDAIITNDPDFPNTYTRFTAIDYASSHQLPIHFMVMVTGVSTQLLPRRSPIVGVWLNEATREFGRFTVETSAIGDTSVTAESIILDEGGFQQALQEFNTEGELTDALEGNKDALHASLKVMEAQQMAQITAMLMEGSLNAGIQEAHLKQLTQNPLVERITDEELSKIEVVPTFRWE